MRSPLPRLLATFSWQELRRHPWRTLAAGVAVMLGVALAFSVQLINASALGEFASAVRAVGGQPDLELRARQGGFDESLYARVAAHPDVALASPVLEVATLAQRADGSGRSVPLRVVGVDALVVGAIAPALMPRVDEARASGRLTLFQPDTVFLNAAAAQALGDAPLQLRRGGGWHAVQVAGRVAAPGEPLAVMDIGAAQALFGRAGTLTRIDLRLAPGADRDRVARDFAGLPQVLVTGPGEAAERASNLSRAYRVNLTVLALVALFTGAFLVFSVLSLSVAQRARQFALLGVLGLTPRERLSLVLAESLALGVAGSAAGLALGTLLAALALRLLGGDLGGGYFQGVAPALRWSGGAALTYGALGLAAALAGGLWPARAAAALAPAQALKGLGTGPAGSRAGRWLGPALMAAGALLALAPPVAGLPLGAYVSVGLLLVGGIVALPALVALLYRPGGPLAPWLRRALPMLAIERARRMRGTAAVAVGGVVASLALSVALTVMVASFRDSVTHWLDAVLPADLYLRSADSASSALGDAVFFEPAAVEAMARLPGVARVAGQRNTPVQLRAGLPPVVLIARPLAGPDGPQLPLVDAPRPVPAPAIAVYVSEAVLDLYGVRTGDALPALAGALPLAPGQAPPQLVVAGVWRDYARQSGSIAIDLADWQRLTGDTCINDVAVWLAPGTSPAAAHGVAQALADTARAAGSPAPEVASAAQIRARSLHIFDRSFAVTYWLQAVAIGIGLFGVAASFSAQVLARRKEFGLLAHLGLTRAQVLAVVTGEGAAWTAVGTAAGLALGIAVSVVLVHVVNPQSFHWTMQLQLPALRLAALCGAVVLAGTATAWIAGRAAAGRDAVLAVKEDW